MTHVEAGTAEMHARTPGLAERRLRLRYRRRPAGARRPCGRGSRPTARVGARRTPHPRRSTGPRRRCRAGHRSRRARFGPRRGPSGHGGGGTDPGRRPQSVWGASRDARPRHPTRKSPPPAPPNASASGVPSRWPYSFMLAPHPALLTTIGAEPGIDAIARVERAAACFVVRDRRARAALRNTPRARASRSCDARRPPHSPGPSRDGCRASTLHHAAGEQPGVGFAAFGDVQPPQTPRPEARDAEPLRHEVQALAHEGAPRECEQHRRGTASATRYANHSNCPSRQGDTAAGQHHAPRLFHEVPELHA